MDTGQNVTYLANVIKFFKAKKKNKNVYIIKPQLVQNYGLVIQTSSILYEVHSDPF